MPQEAIEALPTIQRGLFDFARTSPYFSVSPDSANQDAFLSVAGRNPRYNSIQIDGAVNNDVFGIPATGTPGAQTGAQPISLDAIQELQLVVAPYDVRQGGFTGGGINAVTKSGSNRFSGTAFYFGRNQGMTRSIAALSTPANPDPDTIALEDFKDQQTGSASAVRFAATRRSSSATWTSRARSCRPGSRVMGAAARSSVESSTERRRTSPISSRSPTS